MSEVKWIKICIDIFDDEAIQLIEKMPEGDTILVIWFKLLAKAGKINDNGKVYVKENIPYTDEMLATIFKRDLNIVRMALQTFQNFGMIQIMTSNEIMITNWNKHQNADGLQRLREQGKNRVQKFREKQKLASLPIFEEEPTDKISEIVQKWCDYKREKGSELNDIAKQEFKRKLNALSATNVSIAQKIVDKAIASNWNNIFELTPDEKKEVRKAEPKDDKPIITKNVIAKKVNGQEYPFGYNPEETTYEEVVESLKKQGFVDFRKDD